MVGTTQSPSPSPRMRKENLFNGDIFVIHHFLLQWLEGVPVDSPVLVTSG